jgi:hypothetical protein
METELSLTKALPHELIFMIFELLDSSSLRQLRKIPELSYYINDINYMIQSSMDKDIIYRQSLMIPKVIGILQAHVDNDKLGLMLDSGRWPERLITITTNSFKFNMSLIEWFQVSNIEKTLKSYKDYMITLGIFNNEYTYSLLNYAIYNNLPCNIGMKWTPHISSN